MGPIISETAIEAWEDILPVVFLNTSLVLQLVLLITGELRKHTSKVRLLAWLAYVGADVTASFLLGLLSRKTHHSELFGLWSALLVYHLGGPDNFTAYERADSELWLRHLLYLVLQVVTAAYVIAVNTRGFVILPTLLVFIVGVIRYYERNNALNWSSRTGLLEEIAPIYEYMEHLTRTAGSASASSNQLRFIVAGAKEWSDPPGSDLVTTSDIFEVVSTTFSDSEYSMRRACQLSVAFASSFAYLRRILSLTRLERELESSQSMMRRLWFLNLERKDWLAYILIERDFLYNWLYAKPICPDTYLSRLFLRFVCSMALFSALVLVIVNPSIWGTQAHERLKENATFVVLATGFSVEIAYLLRLVASKRAVVALLVAVVRTQRRTSLLRVSILLEHFCRFSLFLNSFFEKRLSACSKGTSFLPRSNFLIRFLATWPSWVKDTFFIPQPRWDQMYRTVSLNEREIREVQAQEIPALDKILELIEYYSEYRMWHKYFSGGEKRLPIHMLENLDIFVVYYDSNWETILLIWWIGTLKVLLLEGRSKAEQATETSEDVEDHVQAGTGDEDDEIEIRSHSCSNLSEEEKSTFEGESVQAIRNRALWLMAYICRLLTVCPELLPTHLELTKKKVAEELEHFHNQIAKSTNWMEETRSKVARLEIPVLKLGDRRSKEAVDETMASMRKEGLASVDRMDVDSFSTELAVLVVECMSVEDRWALIDGTAAHFVACLGNANRNVEHCAKLTQGGELLTFLWILFAQLGGGST